MEIEDDLTHAGGSRAQLSGEESNAMVDRWAEWAKVLLRANCIAILSPK